MEIISAHIHFSRIDFPVFLDINVAVTDLGNVRNLSITIERQPRYASEVNDSSKMRKLTFGFPSASGGRVLLSALIQSQTTIPINSFWLPGRYTVKLQGELSGNHYHEFLAHFIVLKETTKIALIAYSEHYLYADSGGGQGLFAKGSLIAPETTFDLINLGDNRIALQVLNGQYVGIKDDDKTTIVAKSASKSDEEIFILTDLENNRVAFQANNHQYISVEGEAIAAKAAILGNNETFKLIYLEEQLSAALDELGQLFSENNNPIDTYRNQIISSTLSGASTELLEKVEKPDLRKKFGTLDIDDFWNGLSPCTQKIAYVVVDVIILVLSVFGLQAVRNEMVVRAVARQAGEDLSHLGYLIRQYQSAQNAFGRSRAAYNILKIAVTISMVKTVLQDLYTHMSWWDWTKSSAKAVMEIMVILGTEGTALPVALALIIMNFLDLQQDVFVAFTTCFPPTDEH